jgi:hypothetical protein
MTVLLALAVAALATYFYWVVAKALIRRRTPDFGRDIYRSEQPAQYWLQIILYSLMAAGSTIYGLFLVGDLLDP